MARAVNMEPFDLEFGSGLIGITFATDDEDTPGSAKYAALWARLSLSEPSAGGCAPVLRPYTPSGVHM